MIQINVTSRHWGSVLINNSLLLYNFRNVNTFLLLEKEIRMAAESIFDELNLVEF